MTRLRRSFTAEFKLEAASLVLDQGYSVPEASRSLDVGETVLRRWVQQLQSEQTGPTPMGTSVFRGITVTPVFFHSPIEVSTECPHILCATLMEAP